MAEVIANQMYDPARIEFDELQKLNVSAEKQPKGDEREFRAGRYFVPDGYERVELNGGAVVARRLLSEICERLLDRDLEPSEKVAKRVLAILLKPSTSEQVAEINAFDANDDPTEIKHFNGLKVDDDLEELKKLSKEQSGEFSKFVSGKRKFWLFRRICG